MKSCEEYREALSALLDGELPAEESAALRAHIAACPECRAVYEAYAALHDALRAPQPVPDTLARSVMRQVKKPKTVRWQRYLAMAACFVPGGRGGAAAGRAAPCSAAAPPPWAASVRGRPPHRQPPRRRRRPQRARRKSSMPWMRPPRPSRPAPMPAPSAAQALRRARRPAADSSRPSTAAWSIPAKTAVLADLSIDADAGTPELPDRAADRTAELPEGLLESGTRETA